jgi:hypothetical protein
MSKTAKNLVIILGLITVAFGGYFMFMQQTATTLDFDAPDDAALQSMRTNSQLFIQRKRQLEQIVLDTNFFVDDRFVSLQSYDSPIIEQPNGRDNPFQTVVPLGF